MGKLLIGFIGQGFIGKNYADDFEARGYSVVRYSLEEPFVQNKEKIAECDIVFIAVPTPTTPSGFDYSIVQTALSLVGKGKVAVIKSTMIPGTTDILQKENTDIFVLHSPEFLREVSAAYDAAHPDRNIVGIPIDGDKYREKANSVISILPTAPFVKICTARDAEFIKYGGNNFFYVKVVYMNLLYDLAQEIGCDWNTVQDGMVADPRIGASHMNPVHDSGRGAGGHCFIKDFAAFANVYEKLVGDIDGVKALRAFEEKNIKLLKDSRKDIDLLEGVYGKE